MVDVGYDERSFVNDLDGVLHDIRELLIYKNKAYGNSVLDPIMCFSKENAKKRIQVRMDDKMSRLLRGGADDGEDTKKDLLGYLILERIYDKRESGKQPG